MSIARIVGSNSHIDYVARMASPGSESDGPPPVFGRFVSIAGANERFVGIIYDSRLINPEFGGFGPRLQPRPALEDFGAGTDKRTGVLIGIIILGTLGETGHGEHSLPRHVISAGTEVVFLPDDEVLRFHGLPDGEPMLGYYSRIVSNSGQFAIPLIESVIEMLEPKLDRGAAARLEVLRDSLNWQATIGGATH
jgi:hypothetical protein